MKKRRKHLRNEAGFSLMELMIVIAIIGLLGTVVVRNVMRRYEEAKHGVTKTNIRQLMTTLDDFKRVCGFYPTKEQGLEALVKIPVGGRECKNYDPAGFIKNLPKDGWSNDFIYESDGVKFRISSLGADAKEGGEDIFDKDISSDDVN